MQQYRRGEEARSIPARTERFYKLENDWYFNVRGGKTFGPYPCREEAEKAVEKFLNPAMKYAGNVRPFGNLRARQLKRKQEL